MGPRVRVHSISPLISGRQFVPCVAAKSLSRSEKSAKFLRNVAVPLPRAPEWSIPSYQFFLFCIADEKKQNLASYRKTVRAFVISNRPVAGLLPVQKRPSTRMDKMIAARVTETYASLFLTPKQADGSRYSAIARIGAFEVRLLELPSVNSPEELELWVELYDRNLRVGVDSYKCSDLDETIDAAQFLTAQARQQSRGISAILLRAITSESIAA
jgi:hypothetical protein